MTKPVENEFKKALTEDGLSIIEVAHEADLHPQTLYKIGKKPLSRKSERKLANALARLSDRRSLNNSKATG